MSLNREVVVWKSQGQFHAGMYAWTQTGDDYEWDVEYQYDKFEGVWSGRTEDAAFDALLRENANPGGYRVVTDTAKVAELDKLRKEAEADRRERQRGWL